MKKQIQEEIKLVEYRLQKIIKAILSTESNDMRRSLTSLYNDLRSYGNTLTNIDMQIKSQEVSINNYCVPLKEGNPDWTEEELKTIQDEYLEENGEEMKRVLKALAKQ